jgi:hypothetical protein
LHADKAAIILSQLANPKIKFMATYWADYLISAVRFTVTPYSKFISTVQIHKWDGKEYASGIAMAVADVVALIKQKATVRTVISKNNLWYNGQEVHVFPLNGRDHIRTVENGKTTDNLDNLPQF